MPEVKSTTDGDDLPEALIGRVRAGYREMPGLCLNLQQACRLWQIDPTICTRILDLLLAESFVRRTAAGAFVAGAVGWPDRSMRPEGPH